MSTDSSFGSITTLSLDADLRDRVRDLRDEHGHDNYNETVEHLLACHFAVHDADDDPADDDGLQVGDCTLSQEHPGQVTVRRDGDIVGTIDAQGLREAADLDDQVLSGWWAIWRTYFYPNGGGDFE